MNSPLLSLLKRNWRIKRRKPWQTLQEIVYPIYIVGILVLIRALVDTDQQTQFFDTTYESVVLVPNPIQLNNFNPIVLCTPDDGDTLAFAQDAAARVREELTVIGVPTIEDMRNYNSLDGQGAAVFGGVAFEEDISSLLRDAEQANVAGDALSVPFVLLFNNSFIPPTDRQVDSSERSCRRQDNGSQSGCPAQGYIDGGVISLEVAVMAEFIERISEGQGSVQISADAIQAPTGEAKLKQPDGVLDVLAPIYTVFAFAPVVQFLLVNIVHEKETGRKVYLIVQGTKVFTFWLAWALLYMLMLLIPVGAVTGLSIGVELYTGVNGGIFFLFLLSFAFSLITLSFAISTIFRRAKVAGTIGSLAFSLASLLIFVLKDTSTAVKYVLSLISPVAVTLGVNYLQEKQALGDPAQFLNSSEFTVGSATLMMILDTFLYLILTAYLDQVIPSDLGVRKKWNFPFTSLFKSRKEPRSSRENASYSGVDPEGDEEIDLTAGPAALEIRDLSKDFGPSNLCTETKVVHALTDVNLTVKNGEIFGLLGHNGAGKSTLVNILSGLIPPSTGDAKIFSHDIAEDIDEIRMTLGLVPQSNAILHDELTCTEHMELVCGIKRVDRDDWRTYSAELLQMVGLPDHNKRGGALSGGQKRKLLLAMALVGSPKLLILDEHSAGVDAFARRELWHLLQEHRSERVTLVASHFLDEIEALCDRMMFLEEGKIRCIGTALSLKAEFNIAYTLSAQVPREQRERLIEEVVQAIPSASAMEPEKNNATSAVVQTVDDKVSVLMQLPWDTVPSFDKLFTFLEDSQNDLKVYNLELIMPTLEEVFKSIESRRGEENVDEIEEVANTNDMRLDMETNENQTGENALDAVTQDEEAPQRTQMRRERNRHQFRAMSRMWFITLKREPAVWGFMVFMPVVFLVLGLALGRASNSTTSEPDNIAYDLSFDTLGAAIEAESTSMLETATSSTTQASNSWADSLFSDGSFTTPTLEVEGQSNGLNQYYLDRLQRSSTLDAPIVPSAVIVEGTGGDIFDADADVSINLQFMSNFSYLHELPSVAARLTTSMLRLRSGNDGLSFMVSTSPFSDGGIDFDTLSFFAGFLLSLSFSVVSGSIAIQLVRNRELGLDHALRMAGISRAAQWISEFMFFFLTNLIAAILEIIVIIAFSIPAFSGPALGALIPGVILYMISMMAYAAQLSFFFNREEAVTNAMPAIISTQAWIGFVVIFNLTLFADRNIYVMVNAIMLGVFAPYTMPSLLNFLLLIQFRRDFGFDNSAVTIGEIYSTEAMVWPALLAMFLHTVVDSFLIYYNDVLAFKADVKKNQQKWQKHKGEREAESSQLEEEHLGDEDVQEMRDAVNSVCASSRPNETGSEYHIVSSEVTVAYSKKGKKQSTCWSPEKEYKVAVNELSLMVAEGQRVALLGPNGAGKTSLMNVLTGSTIPSGGTGYIAGYSLSTEPLEAFRHIGYTPQHDRFWDRVTTREHIEFFALLQGNSSEESKLAATRIMEQMGIMEFENKQAKTLSGGTKRKLSLAIATVGSPMAQLHDEPSTGLDILAQQKMWTAVLERTGHASAIISTHNMTEATALCNIVAIMTNGHLRCFGTPQQIRGKYGQGYVVEVVCVPGASQAVFRFMKLLFPDTSVIDAFEGRIRFSVLLDEPHAGAEEAENIVQEVLQWPESEIIDSESLLVVEERKPTKITASPRPSFSVVFRTIQAVMSHLQINNFSFSQPTLEQVFNYFAIESAAADAAEAEG